MSALLRPRIRWLPAVLILAVGAIAMAIIWNIEVWPYEQARSMTLIGVALCTVLFLVVWWFLFSGVRLRTKLIGLLFVAAPLALFRFRGMSGDFIPIFEFRFKQATASLTLSAPVAATTTRPAYPQLFGPTRDARLPGPKLDPNWKERPPQVVWRSPIGAAWSGFVISGNQAITQEQDGENECVSCYELTTGKPLWKTTNPGRYENPIAGVGPRATPAIAGDRVVTLGALGTLRCLDLATGKPLWTREVAADAGVPTPEWGFSSSPLVHEGNVIVSAGGAKSLLAYRLADGEIAWTGGTRPVSYSSPFLLNLAGRPQIVMFNDAMITAHDPATGAVLWEHGWGKGLPHVSRPIPVGDKQIFFSSGYGVGAALFELTADPSGALKASEVWKTPRYQSKFATPIERDGFVYGVSDGIFACLDLRDGSVKWKGGRYGHGQALMIGEYVLQMTEQPGELVLTRPTPEAPNELGRVAVFSEKTWNPIAISGDLLLVRTDREAACLRLSIQAAE